MRPGRGPVGIAGGIFCLAVAASLISYRVYFAGGVSFEFCHYAEIARNLLAGRGFTTLTWYPSYQAHFDAAGRTVGAFAPVLDRFPLQVAWVALFQALFGARDLAVVVAQATAHGLWCAAIYLAGRRLFSSQAASIAALVWAVNPMLCAGFVLHGYADVLFGLLLLCLNVRFVEMLEQGRSKQWIALGALAGLCYLCRYSFVLWIPIYALLILRATGRRALALAAAGYLAVVLPWTVYYFARSGLLSPPLFIQNLAHGVLLSGLPWMEYRLYAFSDFASLHALGALASKWLTLFFRLVEDLPSYWYLAPSSLLAAAWLLAGERAPTPARRFAHLSVLLLAWEAATFSLLRYETLGYMNGRYYLWLGPVVLLCAAAWSEDAWRSAAGGMRRFAGAIVLAIVLVGFGYRFANIARGNDHPTGLPVGDWPEIRWIADHTTEADLIVTNIPAQVAWYAGRPALSFTNEPEGMRPLLAHRRPAYLFLSATRVGEIDNYPAWRALLRGDSRGIEAFCAEYGFEVAETFKGGILLRPVR